MSDGGEEDSVLKKLAGAVVFLAVGAYVLVSVFSGGNNSKETKDKKTVPISTPTPGSTPTKKDAGVAPKDAGKTPVRIRTPAGVSRETLERVRWLKRYSQKKVPEPANATDYFEGVDADVKAFPAFCDLMEVNWKTMNEPARTEFVEAWLAFRYFTRTSKGLKLDEHKEMIAFLAERGKRPPLVERPIQPTMMREVNSYLNEALRRRSGGIDP